MFEKVKAVYGDSERGNQIISYEAIMAYREMFNDSSCGVGTPDGMMLITKKKSGIMFTAPDGETTKSFIDRMNRSRAEGRNLFLKNGQQ